MNIVFHEVETRDWLVDILFWPGYIFISCKESILPPCNHHHRLTAFFMLIAQNKSLFSDKKQSIAPHNSISLSLRKNRLLCFIRVFPALWQTRLPFSSSLKVSIKNLFRLECGFHIITEIFSITRFKTSAVQAIETNTVYKEHLPYASCWTIPTARR